jgi:hypothetical protein
LVGHSSHRALSPLGWKWLGSGPLKKSRPVGSGSIQFICSSWLQARGYFIPIHHIPEGA